MRSLQCFAARHPLQALTEGNIKNTHAFNYETAKKSSSAFGFTKCSGIDKPGVDGRVFLFDFWPVLVCK
jgi:hypothetical protein